MKGTTLPVEIVKRATGRRGKPHIFEDINPKRTALVVVDLQNAFLDPAYGPVFIPAAREIIPQVNAVAHALRSAGGRIYWVKHTADERSRAEWSVLMNLYAAVDQRRATQMITEGDPGHDLWPHLDVQETDDIVQKYRYSAFYPGTCDLPDRLTSQGIETVLIAGTVTNCCCEASARDACMANYQTVMISDACAGHNQAEHDASLAAFYANFGDVMDSEMILKSLHR